MKPTQTLAALALVVGISIVAIGFTDTPAQACGGFFCSQVPVEQSGEQILFATDGTDITAYIQITYSGDAQDFAWVVPVASRPTLDVGSQRVFDILQPATQPRFNLDWRWDNDVCDGFAYQLDSATGGEPSPGADDDGNGVTVVASEEVGPYSTVTLDSNSTEELIAWLNDNGYDQPAESTPLIDHYVQQGMLFVALKLQSDKSAGDIQPLVMKFSEQDPCVPLVLTQVAASPDMPVRIWLLGEHRAVPTNWMHVVINQKKIDWVNYGANYQDVVTQAVDEAAGHGFVTEFAGASERMAEQFYREGQFELDRLRAITDPSDFVRELLFAGLPRDATMQALLRKHIPMPQSLVDQGVSERDFYNNLDQYEAALGDGFTLDTGAFIADIEAKIVTPLRDAQALFDDYPYLTRLFTTVSPEEMTRDPLFAQNPDLGDVDNLHRATADPVCAADDRSMITRVTITLPTGEIYDVTGEIYPYGGGAIDDPAPTESAAARIELVGRTGAPVLVDADRVDAVDRALDQQDPAQVLDDLAGSGPTITPPTTPPGRSSSSCQAGGDVGLAWLLVFLIAALTTRRRVRLSGSSRA